MAQKTWSSGEVLTAADLNTYASHEGGAWTAYASMTLAQGASTNIAKTVNYSNYARIGRIIIWSFDLTLTGSGTASSAITLTLPVTASTGYAVGSGTYFDTGATYYPISWVGLDTTRVFILGGGTDSFGVNPAVTVASGDRLYGQITYEAAS